MNVYKKKLIVIAINNAKERIYKAALKVNEVCQTLKAKVSEEHYFLIQFVTEKSREYEFVKEKEHLICKFNELQTTSSKRNKQQIATTYVKTSIINLTDIVLTNHQTSLLNLGPKFVPTEKKITFKKTATESVALNLEYHNKEADAESLHQNVCHILNKNRNMVIKDNLSKEQRKALKEMRQINNNTKVSSNINEVKEIINAHKETKI